MQAQLSLDAEFPPDSQARRILAAIGTAEVGPVTFSRVTQTIDGDTATVQTAVTRGLKILAGVGGVIEVDVPAGAAPNSRLRRYRVADPYLRFWFRFVAPQMANIARGRGDLAIDAVGGWWNRDHSTEVDLVATHGPRVRAVGSVKWRTTTPFDADDAAVLRGVRQVVPGADDAALVAVCPAGVTDEAGVDLVLRADDLLAAWGVRAS